LPHSVKGFNRHAIVCRLQQRVSIDEEELTKKNAGMTQLEVASSLCG
jgi:hypothetical protein